MSTSEKAIAEANAVSSKKQAQASLMPNSKQAVGQLKQTQAQVLSTPTSKHQTFHLSSTPTSKPAPKQPSKHGSVMIHPSSKSKQAGAKEPLIEPLPSVTISTKSSSQTLREFRAGHPSSNPSGTATASQKVATALEAIQQRHGPAMQKVSCPTISPKYIFLVIDFFTFFDALFTDPELWERA